MEEKKYENLEHALCKELEELDAKFRQGQKMSSQDLETIDKVYHALKSMATYNAMKEAEGYEEEGGFSGRRGRSSVTGRYVSRDSNTSYADGYSQGYSEAMSQMNGGGSGHYYPMPPYNPMRRY